ncbi:hypothetical protein PVAP13_8NG181700 [Panicum virgatum]|uniref:Auxin-responsive protein n=1 Tax=Panicum virgatum TaxID=38727 RepID=A0A8T0P8M3_PANVG|nr:hypothetical protein PVAP13_8NG181700 [Panicum virgatum]
MDGMRSTDTCVEREVDVRPRLSPSRFVKVFMQGGVVGRKINLATHQNYASLSFTLKRLGNNYSMPSCELNGLANNEDDGSLDDNFILFYDNVDGDRFFLGEVPCEVFTISVKRIYIVPIPRDEENVADNEEEEEDREINGGDIAATSGALPDGDDIPANDDEVADDGDATNTPAD